MLECPVVVLVGGPSTGKTRFFINYTNSAYFYPSRSCTPNVTLWNSPSFVLVDTPGKQENRDHFEYSWQGIFQYADVLLDFGNWSEDEVFGNKIGYNPKYMTWSGDNQETMKRLQEYLQERK
jgi:hypothetical protein